MKPDNCKIISEYENSRDFPESERVTEYSEELGCYVLKMDVTPGKMNERLSEAMESKEGKYIADGQKLNAVLQVVLAHNIKDMESYPLAYEDEMLQVFLSKESIEKTLGIKDGSKTHSLIRKVENRPPELIALPLDIEKRYLERLDGIRSRWYKKLLEKEREQYQTKIDEIISTGANTGAKQAKFDFTKEITRRMKTYKKVFFEERMEGYDFREVDLSDALFISCCITNSNFSGVNLENAAFINCEMKNCMFYGAMLNNCRAYYGGTEVNLSDKTRRIIL